MDDCFGGLSLQGASLWKWLPVFPAHSVVLFCFLFQHEVEKVCWLYGLLWTAIAWLGTSLNTKQYFPPSAPGVGGEVSSMSDVQSLSVNSHLQHDRLFQLHRWSEFAGVHKMIFFIFE